MRSDRKTEIKERERCERERRMGPRIGLPPPIHAYSEKRLREREESGGTGAAGRSHLSMHVLMSVCVWDIVK